MSKKNQSHILLPWTRISLLVSNVNDDVTGIDDVGVVVKDQDGFPLRLLVKLLDQLLLGCQGGREQLARIRSS